jgi:hypothetical protein
MAEHHACAVQASIENVQSSLHSEKRSVRDLQGTLKQLRESATRLPAGAADAAKLAALQDEVCHVQHLVSAVVLSFGFFKLCSFAMCSACIQNHTQLFSPLSSTFLTLAPFWLNAQSLS